MPTNENVRIGRRFYTDVLVKGQLNVIDEIVSPKLVEHEELAEGTPSGVEGLRVVVNEIRTAFPDLQITVDQEVVQGSLVAYHATFSGTHRGPFLGHAATNRPVSFHVIDIVKFSRGKITEHWGVTDLYSVVEQIGVLPQQVAVVR